jgi:hypothetical protein
MSYARTLLSRGEEVIFESRQHWFAVLARTWAFVIASILSLAVVLWSAGLDSGIGQQAIQIISLVVLIGSLGRIGWMVLAWRNQEYLVTNRRLIKAEGIFNKEMADSGLEKVNDAHLTQSLLGRIFDYGTLDILTAAEESAGIQDYEMLADPVKFKIAMLNQKERLDRPELAPAPRMQGSVAVPTMQRADPMPPRAGSDRVAEVRPPEPEPLPPVAAPVAAPAPPPADELVARLESLASLRDRGLITPEEYETKKRDILERM